MSFISLGFYILLTMVIGLYYILPLKYRYISLLIGSLVFYWILVDRSFFKFGSFLTLALLCYAFSLVIVKIKNKNNQIAKYATFVMVLITAIPLIINKVSGSLLILIGLSFYTLQMIAYLVDVYKGKIQPQKNLFKYLLFISFFPQIIQGPIPRYEQLGHQLYEGHKFNEKKFTEGFLLIIWGFFLKLVIADKAAVIVNTVFDNFPTYQGMYVVVAGILYSLQLYADFLACVTLAQGIALLFGIDIIDNFNHPYFAKSIKDFWRRWHISLSAWLRDYVYIPLGGNRKGKVRKYINLLITFIVSGAWHGDGIKFIIWGLMHGIYQLLGEWLAPVRRKIYELIQFKGERVTSFIQQVFTFVLVTIAWIVFRANGTKNAVNMLLSIVKVYNPWVLWNDSLFNLGLNYKDFYLLVASLLFLWGVSLVQENGVKIRDRILNQHLLVRWTIYIGAIIFIMIFGTYGYGFDAQAFIYGGF